MMPFATVQLAPRSSTIRDALGMVVLCGLSDVGAGAGAGAGSVGLGFLLAASSSAVDDPVSARASTDSPPPPQPLSRAAKMAEYTIPCWDFRDKYFRLDDCMLTLLMSDEALQ